MRLLDSFPTNKKGSLEYRAGHVLPFGATLMGDEESFAESPEYADRKRERKHRKHAEERKRPIIDSDIHTSHVLQIPGSSSRDNKQYSAERGFFGIPAGFLDFLLALPLVFVSVVAGAELFTSA